MTEILLYPKIIPKGGTGNILRMCYFYEYLSTCHTYDQVSFISNNNVLASNIIDTLDFNIPIQSNLKEGYDVIVYDSPDYNLEEIKSLKKKTNRLVALDFFYYNNPNVDIIINLYNHNKEQIYNCKEKIYEGLKYALLKKTIIKSRISIEIDPELFPKICVTFGGEDPNSNTLKVLENIDFNKANVEVILGYLNKDRDEIVKKYGKKVVIRDTTPHIGSFIAQSDIIICGGGTTLLESIYLGNPIIALPQNNKEDVFINYIRESVPLYHLSDMKQILKNCKDGEFRKLLRKKYESIIDDKGKERIYNIITRR